MDLSTLEVQLADGRKIRWIFHGRAAERLELLSGIARIQEADSRFPAAVQVDVFVSERQPWDWMNWNPLRTIVYNDGIAARLCADDRVEIHLFRMELPSRSFEVDQLARILWYGFLPLVLRRELLIVHGALLAFDGQGVVASGPSGAGKTTCARRVSRPWLALADDAVLLSRTAVGYCAQGLPTLSALLTPKEAPVVSMSAAVKLLGIYRIVQAKEDRVLTMPMANRTLTLIKMFCDIEHIWKIKSGNVFRHALCESMVDFVMNAIRSITVGELHCTLTGEFWKEIGEFKNENQSCCDISG